jgi:osmoprotectant transport system permease protein
MTIAIAPPSDRPSWLGVDKLGVFIALLAAAGASLPFALFRATRIVPGQGRSIIQALPPLEAGLLWLVLLAGFAGALLRLPRRTKLACAALVLVCLAGFIGRSAQFLSPPENTFARVSPGAGFWLLLFGFALMLTDCLTRLRLRPWQRLLVLAAVTLVVAVLLWSGAWNQLSILKEYSTRSAAFWNEGRTHLGLAMGSVAAAVLIGAPLGIICFKLPALRAAVLNTLNIVQTIPSIALFGLLIAPLAWVAANVPGASAVGISGIGTAPALVALFAYSLLPIVANTVVGLLNVPLAAVDAARGMGMTGWQRLRGIQLPLAFPVILTGIRIVLVQNIGLATIAALIGGGGFGVFVFQGIGQTAMDLVLLGAVPTVALAFTAAVVLDALVEMSARTGRPA